MIEINATIIAQILNFLILVVILRAVAYKPVVRLLQQRSDKIQNSIDKAEADQKAAEATLAQYKQKLQDANIKAQEIVDKAEKVARDEHDATVLATKKEIDQMKKAAEEDIQRDRERAVAQLKGEVITLSLAAAGKIISKNIDNKENERLIGEFINQLDKEKLGDLSC
ncbi:MAG: F0F1 ATP synthase subunit B [Selenomonadaceae bacterium]|nr:F0F1 ATP synthase subunit B [Selenomonadaceae bacterium]MBR1859152.1 F0F1 ATP synthase subunit B [Selenomonadaceae bacterium]